jgi:hypothetical protein
MSGLSIVSSGALLAGHGFADLWSEEGYKAHLDGDPLAIHGDLQVVEFTNLITNVGDEYYAERAAGIASPPGQVTGMQLGTGSTAVAKNGAGAAVVTYITSSAVAIDGGFPTSTNTQTGAVAITIAWKTTWAAGVATATGINEVVLINQAVATNSAAPAANTISRALLSPVVNKGASDTLAITWNHNLLGA